MAIASASRADYLNALPTFTETASLIGLDASGVSRAVKRLRIEPHPWGNREKHLAVVDVFRIAMHANRLSLEEVAGGLLDWVEREHPDQAGAVRREIDAFFMSLREPQANPEEEFFADLRAGLPATAAERAIEIYRAHTAKIQ